MPQVFVFRKPRRTARRHSAAALLCLLLSVLAGCAPLTDQDQPGQDPAAVEEIRAGRLLGQTFVARHGGLSGMDVWLQPLVPGDATVRLHVRSDPTCTADVAVAELPLSSVTTPAFYRFAFPPLTDAQDRYLYGFLEVDGEGAIQAGATEGAAYLSGALYRDHRPLDAQLAFRLVYDKGVAGLEFVRAEFRDLALIALATLLLVLPGWALLRLARLERCEEFRLDFGDRLGLAVGLSLAFYPLLLLWTHTAGWHLGAWYAWAPVVAAILVLAWLDRPWRYLHHVRKAVRLSKPSEATWISLTLVAALLLVMGVRLLVARTLEGPSWGDSVQHAVIAQLFVDNAGLFDSWQPYTPYTSLTVQYGFSVAAALLSWTARLDAAHATLLAGQLLNGMAVVALYPLGRRIAGGNRWAGIGTVVVAGLLMPMPAYYVNWGRYAQLAGQVILPIAVWLLWDFLERKRMSWPVYSLAAMSLAGLLLTYYRMPFYYAAFVPAWLLMWALPRWPTDWRRWVSAISRLGMVLIAAVVVLLPWLLHVQGSSLSAGLEGAGGGGTTLASVLAEYRSSWRDVLLYLPRPLLLVSLGALGWALIRRRWTVVLVGLWTVIMAALVAGRLIGLPGSYQLQSFAVMILLYIPAGLLCGWLFGELADYLKHRRLRFAPALLAGLLLVFAVWGARGQAGIVGSQFIMITRPDSRAMAWIRENTPPEAKFLVEGFRIYGGRSVVGADAGWWIPLLAGRANTMPPQYALLNEVPATPGYTQRVVRMVETLETNAPGSMSGLRALCREGVTHVYIGQTQGLTGGGVRQLFAPADFASPSLFKPVYRQDRVHIFELDPNACRSAEPLS